MLLLILRFVSVFKILLTMRAAPQSRRLILSSYPPPQKKKNILQQRSPLLEFLIAPPANLHFLHMVR